MFSLNAVRQRADESSQHTLLYGGPLVSHCFNLKMEINSFSIKKV